MNRAFFVLALSLFFGLFGMQPACSPLTDSSKNLNEGLDPWEQEEEEEEEVEEEEPEEEEVPKVETCDGRDNDGDGEVDEDTDGTECTTSDDELGTLACIAGKLVCWVCEPGSTREVSCGCGITRLDICGEDGIWRKGGCDPCENPEPAPCSFCGTLDESGVCLNGGECQPGSVMYRRCDSCPNDTGCGPTTCVGEKWECTSGCTWEKTEDCGIRPSSCDRDARMIERCGQCGLQMLQCDGCFWNRGECREQGSCFPGARRPVPCFGEHCAEGWSNQLSCNYNCEWVMGQQCQGCTPGVHTEMVECVYNSPRCGKRERQYECVITQEATECLPAVGTKMNYTYLTSCPPIECYPGQQQTQNCMLDSGAGGTQHRTCNSYCEWSQNWSPCGGGNNSCVPGEQEVEVTDCGCGASYTTTKTCQADGLGWDTEVTGREDCPECMSGQSSSQSCTTGGVCGTQTVSCDQNCNWTTSECQALPNACVNGSTETRACSHTCGPGTGSYTCIGCHWYLTGQCVPDNQFDCLPGESRTVNCNPEGCPQQQDVCSNNCQWLEGDCPPCG